MILHRYMSGREFEAFMRGEVLTNNTDHSKNAKTKSKGFCFFTDEPEEAIRWLRGIVTLEVCAKFEVPENKVKKTVGTYCDHDKTDNSFGACIQDIMSYFMDGEMPNVVTMEKEEYCCRKYSNKDFKLISYSFSKSYEERKRLMEEWDRPREELPEGVLLRGTLIRGNEFHAFNKIADALKETPLQGGMSIENNERNGLTVTLPDGRIVREYNRIEIMVDGTVLINGRLLAPGFPSLSIRNGDYYLIKEDCSSIQVTAQLFDKYHEALLGTRI